MSTPVEAEVVFNKMDGRLTFNKNDEDLVDTNHTSYNAIGGLSASGKEEATIVPVNEEANEKVLSTGEEVSSSSNNILMMEVTPEEDSPLKETSVDPFTRPKWMRRFNGLHSMISFMCLFSVLLTIALVVQIQMGVTQVPPHAAVSSSNKQCSKLAINLLHDDKQAASTMDAVIVASLCMSVLHPYSGGIGGGGFILVHDLRREFNSSAFYDFRETSPHFITKLDGFTPDKISAGIKVGVPGYLIGLEKAHSHYGRVSWKDLVMKVRDFVIERNGLVSHEFASMISAMNLSDVSSSLKKLVVNENGGMKLQQGDKIPNQPEIANLLKKIAEKGSRAFYSGAVVEEVVKLINLEGGNISVKDFSEYKIKITRNVRSNKFGDMSVISGSDDGYSSSVSYIIDLLNSLEQPKGSEEEKRFLQIHRFIEALKYSAGALTAKSKNETRKVKVDDGKIQSSNDDYLLGYEPIRFDNNKRQFVTALGHDYIAISAAMSLGSQFGSNLVTQSGVVLNDAIMDFSWKGKSTKVGMGLPPAKGNLVVGGSRPKSPLLPIITIPLKSKCGKYNLLGDGGTGSSSLPAIGRVLLSLSANDNKLQDAINVARFFPHLITGELLVEDKIPEKLKKYLVAIGHKMKSFSTNSSSLSTVVDGVRRGESGNLHVNNDKRQASEGEGGGTAAIF